MTGVLVTALYAAIGLLTTLLDARMMPGETEDPPPLLVMIVWPIVAIALANRVLKQIVRANTRRSRP